MTGTWHFSALDVSLVEGWMAEAEAEGLAEPEGEVGGEPGRGAEEEADGEAAEGEEAEGEAEGEAETRGPLRAGLRAAEGGGAAEGLLRGARAEALARGERAARPRGEEGEEVPLALGVVLATLMEAEGGGAGFLTALLGGCSIALIFVIFKTVT